MQIFCKQYPKLASELNKTWHRNHLGWLTCQINEVLGIDSGVVSIIPLEINKDGYSQPYNVHLKIDEEYGEATFSIPKTTGYKPAFMIFDINESLIVDVVGESISFQCGRVIGM